MSFEFLSDMALGPDESEIEQAVLGKEKYSILRNAPWTIKGKVLATGLAEENKHYSSLLKDGQDGYPHSIKFASDISLLPDWNEFFLPQPDQMALLPLYSVLFQLDLKLASPFYSRDDLAFYPTENPLRREWVFGAPYLSAAGVKGLLRWAWQMCWSDEKMDMETKLFGPRQGNLDEENARRGRLYTYPLFWKGAVGLDVINPHDRSTGTGINPIKYEIVKPGGTTSLFLLSVNRTEDMQTGLDAVAALEDPLTLLLYHSGLSAKRSAGWGSVDVLACKAWISVPPGRGAADCGTESAEDIWSGLTDDQGCLKPVEDEQTFTTARLARMTGKSKSWVKKKQNKPEARRMVVEMWEKMQEKLETSSGDDTSNQKPETASHDAPSVKKLTEDLHKTFMALKNA
jgi:hypothetical protein